MSKLKIDKNGDRFWLNEDGMLHRIDGPAVEENNGSKEWFFNGERHREDGPAIELNNGHKSWWINNKLHRIDGPAIEWNDGDKSWFINDKQLTEEEFNEMSMKCL